MNKKDPKAPKKFKDCEKVYPDCEVPKEHSFGMKKRRRVFFKKGNQTANATVQDDEQINTTPIDDLVTKYVANE
jgi:hypothetical protein